MKLEGLTDEQVREYADDLATVLATMEKFGLKWWNVMDSWELIVGAVKHRIKRVHNPDREIY